MRTVRQGSTAGLTRRLVAHLLVFKERWLPELPITCVMDRIITQVFNLSITKVINPTKKKPAHGGQVIMLR